MQPDINSKEWKAERRKLINLAKRERIKKKTIPPLSLNLAKRERIKKKTIPPLSLKLQNYCPICHRHNVSLTKHHYKGRKVAKRRIQWVCWRCHDVHNRTKGPYGKIVNDYYKSI